MGFTDEMAGRQETEGRRISGDSQRRAAAIRAAFLQVPGQLQGASGIEGTRTGTTMPSLDPYTDLGSSIMRGAGVPMRANLNLTDAATNDMRTRYRTLNDQWTRDEMRRAAERRQAAADERTRRNQSTQNTIGDIGGAVASILPFLLL